MAGRVAGTKGSRWRNTRLPASPATHPISHAAESDRRHCDIPCRHRGRSALPWLRIRHGQNFAAASSRANSRNAWPVTLRVETSSSQVAKARAGPCAPIPNRQNAGTASTLSHRPGRSAGLGEKLTADYLANGSSTTRAMLSPSVVCKLSSVPI